LAAIALVGATVRPEGILMVAAALLDLLLERRYRVLATWAGIMGPLFLLSLLQIGFWIPDFLGGVDTYVETRIWTYPPNLIGVGALSPVFVIGVVVWGGWLLWQMRPLPDRTRIPFSLSVITIVYLLVLPQSKDYTLVYGLLPAWVIIWASGERWWNALLVLLILLSSWLHFYIGTNLERGLPLEQLFTPIFLGVLITLSWRQWRQQNLVAQEV
jgi:hypothetical protein